MISAQHSLVPSPPIDRTINKGNEESDHDRSLDLLLEKEKKILSMVFLLVNITSREETSRMTICFCLRDIYQAKSAGRKTLTLIHRKDLIV